MSNKIYPALNERIAEALTDDFNFSEGLLKELSAIINRVIEDYSKAGLPFTKALAEFVQSETRSAALLTQIADQQQQIDRLEAENERYEEAFRRLQNWTKAYPQKYLKIAEYPIEKKTKKI